MENHKIRVAITQGDANGIGYELIFKTFAEQEMLELCTPIIYGSPKNANYHNNILQTQCQFNIIKDAKEAKDGVVNLLSCVGENIRVDFGKESAEVASAAEQALGKALADTREKLCDILVCAPMNKDIENIAGEDVNILPIYLNENLRVVMQKDSEAITQEKLSETATILHKALKRDFRLSNPRIAILAMSQDSDSGKEQTITDVVTTLKNSGIQIFGPYMAEEFIDERKYEAFDAVITLSKEQGTKLLCMSSNTDRVVSLANSHLVCTTVDTNARYDIAGKNCADEAGFRNAIYTGIDICRHRKEYDEPMANPLPKLYHERPDNGEKLRFSIPKKQEEA